MGQDASTPNPRKNSEVATDSESNAYHIWTGADQGIYMARSTDSGDTWDSESIRISPAEVISTTFPQTDAGDPGRIAITYLGSENGSLLNPQISMAIIGTGMDIMHLTESTTTSMLPTV